MRNIQLICCLLFSIFAMNANAQTENKLPGDPTLVSSDADLQKLIDAGKGDYKYQAEDYFQRPSSSEFQISPDGKYLSFKKRAADGKVHLYIKDIATNQERMVVEEKDELIRNYSWISSERLVFSMDQGGNEYYHIYTADINGGKTVDLTPFDGVKANLETVLGEEKNKIIITMNKDNDQVFEPYKLDAITGTFEKLFENKDAANAIIDYNFDKKGKLKGFAKIFEGTNVQYFYKPEGASDFQLYQTSTWEETFGILAFNFTSSNPDEVYVLSNLDSDKKSIYRYDFKTKQKKKLLFANKEYDARGISLSGKRNFEIDYYSYEGEKKEIVPVSKAFKKIYKNLSTTFKGYEIEIVGKTSDERKYLIKVTSDKQFGKYYLYDSKTTKSTFLYELLPNLKEADMAAMKPITFKSRDGLTLHGYITLPKEALQGKKVPMIVNPHGGPQAYRDSWCFNPETQFFASRGYATLQVNFRISGGYGKEFFKIGTQEIGRKIQDDLEDGVNYVVEKGWVDKDRIGIYGGSHGGYATLMGMIKTPDLYKAGVNYVGISNVETFINALGGYWKPYRDVVKKVWYDIDDPHGLKLAKEVSPIYHYDKIKKPLFVVEGANDTRVNISEADQIVKALRDKGFDVPYMVKYNEGHGFQREENYLQFYKAMIGFFSLHLK